MDLSPHLSFDGHCEAAFKFYEQCLGGKITFMMKYGDSPAAGEVASDWREKILHATIMIGNHALTGADAPGEHYSKPQGFSLTLDTSDAVEADRIFKALAENGQVQMPLQETFWALRFAMLVDQFGIPWMINCGKPA
jgi:PhnB protein